jgi:transposase
MRRIRQILEYRIEKKISAEKTASALAVSKGTVINVCHRYTQSGLPWPLPADMSDSTLKEKLYPAISTDGENKDGLPVPDYYYLEQELRKKHMCLQRLWEEYQEANPEGMSRATFYRRWEEHRPKEPEMKNLHKGGDKLFIDYSGDSLEYIDRTTGECIDVELFVCSWGASSYSYVEATLTQTVDDFISSHVRALEFFGVVPNALVPDNLKSGVQKADRYDPVVNPLYAELAKHYGTVVIPARVREPKDKAVVESNVLHVQRYILARLRNRQFFSLAEINDALGEELVRYNNLPMKEYGNKSRKERFTENDIPFAKDLPVEPFRMSKVKLGVRVAPNYHVRFENHYYSVPYQHIGKQVDLYITGNILEIYADNIHCCRHKVGPQNFQYSTKPDHMPPNHLYVKGWSRGYFLSKAYEIGDATAQAIDRVMKEKQHVQQGFNAALGILQLAKSYTPQRLEAACARALYYKYVSVKTLRTILDEKLDKVPLQTKTQPSQTDLFHENLRGPNYYN